MKVPGTLHFLRHLEANVSERRAITLKLSERASILDFEAGGGLFERMLQARCCVLSCVLAARDSNGRSSHSWQCGAQHDEAASCEREVSACCSCGFYVVLEGDNLLETERRLGKDAIKFYSSRPQSRP